MKITTTRDDLLKPLLKVGNVVERRQTLPILANILISTNKNTLSLTATDLEVELKTEVAVTSDESMEVTLPAKKLTDICKALPEDAKITLDIDGDKAILRAGRGRYTLGTLPAQDYPSIEPTAASETFSLPEKVLKNLIDKTQFAMAQQDVRYYLNGMLFELKAGSIRTVATDGHRLALCDAELEGRDDLDMQIILPRKAVLELGRLLSDTDDLASIEMSNSHIRINLQSTTFTSKLIDGRFPDYERVMPEDASQVLTSDKELLRQALSRTAILSNEKYRGIRFKVSPGLLHLQAHNPEQDEAEEELEIQYDGAEEAIGFNVSYLIDVLNAIDGNEIKMSITDANSSSLVTPIDSDKCRYVIMPMRI